MKKTPTLDCGHVFHREDSRCFAAIVPNNVRAYNNRPPDILLCAPCTRRVLALLKPSTPRKSLGLVAGRARFAREARYLAVVWRTPRSRKPETSAHPTRRAAQAALRVAMRRRYDEAEVVVNNGRPLKRTERCE